MRKSGMINRAVLGFLTAIVTFSVPAGVRNVAADSIDVNISEMTDEEREGYELTKKYERTLPKMDPRTNIDESRFKKKRKSSGNKGTVIPSRYDQKDNRFLSPVKDQNITGTCWCFSALEAAQDSLMSHDKNYEGAPDFSEFGLSYFIYNQPVDRLGLTDGDRSYTNSTPGSKNYYLTGGTELMTAFALAKGIGASDESTAKFTDLIDDLHGTGLATLPDGYCYNNNIYTLSGCEIYNAGDESVRDDIKLKIMENGAGQIGYTSDSNFYDYTTYSYCSVLDMLSPSAGGHDVAVVGWDDNYSPDNFKVEPKDEDGNPLPGAWLIKNSWGDFWGLDGYFWMSYYEPTLGKAFFYDVESVDAYDSIYQYDGTESVMRTAEYKSEANVFTAQRNEIVNAVSFFTTEDDTDYTVYIYKNPDPDNPTSGELMFKEDGNVANMGYRKVNLPEDSWIDVSEGDTFSIVVNKTVDGNATSMYVDASMDAGWVKAKSVSHKGESFVSAKNSDLTADDWEDLSASGSRNLRIKAFTTVNNDAAQVSGSEIKFDKTEYEVVMDKKVTADVKIVDGDKEESILGKRALSFTVEDEKIAFVDDMGHIYPRKAGETAISVTYKTAGGNLTATANVKVINDSSVTSIDLSKEEGYATEDNHTHIILGENFTPEFTVIPSSYIDDVEYYAEALDKSINIEEAYEDNGDGSFSFYKPGSYRLTASINDRNELTGSEINFYIDVDLGDFYGADELESLNVDPYANEKYYMYRYYDPDRNGYVITMDYDIEENYDTMVILGYDDEKLTAREIYDGYYNSDYEDGEPSVVCCDVLTGVEKGRTISVPHKCVAFLIIPDMFVNGYFKVTGVRDYISPDSISMKAGDMKLDLKVDRDNPYTFDVDVKPEGAVATEVCCYSGNEAVAYATFNAETKQLEINARKVGKTSVFLYLEDFDETLHDEDADDDGNITGRSLKIEVEVLPSGETIPDEFKIKSGGGLDGVIILQRNKKTKIEFTEEGWGDYQIEYSSEKPSVVDVDENGNITGVSETSKDVKVTAKVDVGGETREAVINVQVTVPPILEKDDMQTLHPYIRGMEDTYTYKSLNSETECMNIYFDNESSMYDGDYFTICDGNGYYYGYDEDEGTIVYSKAVIVDGGDEDIVDDSFKFDNYTNFGRLPLTIYDDEFSVHFITTEPDEDEYSEDEEEYDRSAIDEETDEGRYGFRIKRIEEGKVTTGLSIANMNLDFSTYNSHVKKVQVTRTPADAIDHIYYGCKNYDIADINYNGVVRAYRNGEAKIVAFIDKPDGTTVNGTATVTVGYKALKSLEFVDMTTGNDTELTEDECSIEFPLDITGNIQFTKNPWNSNEEIELEYDHDDMYVYLEENDNNSHIMIEPYRMGTFRLYIKANLNGTTGKEEKKIVKTLNITVTEPEAAFIPDEFRTFNKDNFEIDGNSGRKPEEITAEDLRISDYQDGYSIYWTYKKPGADYVEIVFDEEGYLERNYDWLYIYNLDGELVGAYTGGKDDVNSQNRFAGSTIKVMGEGFILAFRSEEYSSGEGFKVTDINPHVTVKPDDKPSDNPDTSADNGIKKGQIVKVGKGRYKVLSDSTVAFNVPVAKNPTKFTVPATVKIKGKTYKVTEISAKAFKNKKKLKKVVIGKNVKKIGTGAFLNCKSLKNISIKSSVLKTVGKNAIKGINKKTVIKTPKKKLKAYKKLFKAKTGYKKTMKIKK